MAVIAVASIAGEADPQNKTITYANAVGVGGTSVTLNGGGTSDSGVVYSFEWVILEKPTGSNPALSPNATTQNPTLTGIDTVGTYRVFLKSTVSATGAVSTSNILDAPDSAFVSIHVTTQNAALFKPAKGERNWHDEYWHLVDYVDSLKGEVDAITTATDTNTGELTCLLQGTRVRSVEEGVGGWLPGYLVPPNTADGNSIAHAAFRLGVGVQVTQITVSMGDSGKGTAPNHRTTFQVREATSAQYIANTGSPNVGTLLKSLSIEANDHKPAEASVGDNTTTTSGNLLLVIVTEAPTVPGMSAEVRISWAKV